MEKGKRVETENGEIPLPEAIIQHIQSFLSGKEAARTTILSKSWYNAWLTRPAIDLDEFAFHNLGRESWDAFEELVKKTMKRYQDLNLNIESFRLRSFSYDKSDTALKSSIVSAMTMGASNVELELPYSLKLPQEVLGSETLLRLSLNGCKADGNYFVSCSRLKSLSLESVHIGFNDVFEDIILLCTEMEELSLSKGHRLPLHLIELHKLRRLSLYQMDIDDMFFSDIATRFPCLKDLTIVRCRRCARIQVASSSLETITLEPYRSTYRAKFDIPNIQKFSYTGSGLPHLSIKASSRQWEFYITMACTSFHNTSWFLNLKKSLAKFRQSRISLSMSVDCKGSSEHEVDIEAVPQPLMLENLMIDAPSSSFCALLLRLFGFFRPRFVTAKFCPRRNSNGCLDILCKILMQQVITPNCGIPDQDLFGQFGLKKVNMEVYNMFGKEWQPLALEKPLDPSVALPLEQKE